MENALVSNGNKRKLFFNQWYGKVALATISAVAVLVTVGLVRFPLNDRDAALKRLTAVEKEIIAIRVERIQELREWDKWQARVDATQEYMVKQLDAIGERVGAPPVTP